MATLLIVAEADADRGQMTSVLSDQPGWELLESASLEGALEQLEKHGVDLLLLEISTHESATSRVSRVGERFPNLPVLIIAPDDDHPALVDALMFGAASYVPRGLLAHELVRSNCACRFLD